MLPNWTNALTLMLVGLEAMDTDVTYMNPQIVGNMMMKTLNQLKCVVFVEEDGSVII